jgi:site-specific recombinase XerD
LEDSKTIPFKKKIIQKFSKYLANINNQLKTGLSKEKQHFYVLIKIQAQHNITPKQIPNIIKKCKGELGCASWISPPRLEEFYTFKASLIVVFPLCFSFTKFSFTTLKA